MDNPHPTPDAHAIWRRGLALLLCTVGLLGLATQVVTARPLADAPTGVISGCVTDRADPPVALPGIAVQLHRWTVFDADYAYWDDSLPPIVTDSSGCYMFDEVEAGVYRVRFEDVDTPRRYLSQIYQDAPDDIEGETATNLEISDHSTEHTNIDAALQRGVDITGAVSGPDAGGTVGPLVGIGVAAYRCADVNHCDYNLPAASAATNDQGNYILGGLAPGAYAIGFNIDPQLRDYVPAYYDGKPTLATADVLDLSAYGALATAIDALLTRTGRIEGTATANGDPIADILVCLMGKTPGSDDWQEGCLNTPFTNIAGYYAFDALPPGDYRLLFEDTHSPMRVARRYSNAQIDLSDAANVTVAAGATTQVDIALGPGARIEGRIADGDDADLPDIQICLVRAGHDVCAYTAQSGPAGTYDIDGIEPDTYTVRFTDTRLPARYLSAYWDGRVAPSQADPLVLSATGTPPAVDAQLRAGARLAGTLVDAATLKPLAGAQVTLYRVPTWRPRIDPGDDDANTCESNLSKLAGAGWSQPAPTAFGVQDPSALVTPTVVTQFTDAAGRYGWTVMEGCWYVVAEKSSYGSAVSPVAGLPPTVDDLNVALTSTVVTASFSATPAAGLVPLVVAFTDTSTGPVESWAWDFGEGGSSLAQHPVYTYTQPGAYPVALTVTGPANSHTHTQTVTVQDVPIGGLVVACNSPTPVGSATVFSATVASGSNIGYTWDFGDGAHGSGSQPSHTYAATGLYTATVTALNHAGMVTATTAVIVGDIPVGGIVASNDGPTALGNPTTFQVTITTGSNVSYVWDFGDGSQGSGVQPTHTYTTAGLFTATVTASNSANALSAMTPVVVVDDDEPGDPTGAVAGIVFLDANRNERQDKDEPGIPDVEIWLSGQAVTRSASPRMPDAAIHLTTRTDDQGAYRFAAVPYGRYTLTFLLPPQYMTDGPTSAEIEVGRSGAATPAVEFILAIQEKPAVSQGASLFLPAIVR